MSKTILKSKSMFVLFLLLTKIVVLTRSQETICGCNSVNETTNTCYINLKGHPNCSVECNSNYSNCVINVPDYVWWTYVHVPSYSLHCPSENCLNCAVYGDTLFNSIIYGYACSLLTIDVKYIWYAQITAPGNGGTLICKSLYSFHVNIYSVNGTQNMAIYFVTDINIESDHIDVDGSYV